MAVDLDAAAAAGKWNAVLLPAISRLIRTAGHVLAAPLGIHRVNTMCQVVDVSLVESVFKLMESLVPEYDLLGHVRERSGGALPGIAPSNTYPTRDGAYVVIAGNSDPIFRRLMDVIGRSDLGNDAAFAHDDGRAARVDLLDAAIAGWTSQQPIGVVLAAGKSNVPHVRAILYWTGGIWQVNAADAKAKHGQLVSISRDDPGFADTQRGLVVGMQHRF